MTRIVIDNAAVSTMDSYDTEYRNGYLVVDGDRVEAVGDGKAPRYSGDYRYIDATGCLVTPGLVNTHHHLYQWATRGLAADAALFEWLVELYPVWARLDTEITYAAASAGLSRLVHTGCTTVADHHYIFPAHGGDQLSSIVSAARRIGVRLHAVRGSMDRGRSHGGLPPDNIVESTDQALTNTAQAIAEYHDPEPDSRVRIAIGPCSPFSVTRELMEGAAALARRTGVRLHTHLAETLDEQQRCQAEFGCTPAEYADQLGWLGTDVWLAHGVHLDESAIKRIGATGTGVAHCPTSNGRLGSGIAPVRELVDSGAPIGLGVDGAASNESGGLAEELHQAVLAARFRGGPKALTARESLSAATIGGARCLGREAELGTLEPGKLADIAVWRMDGIGHAGIDDPVAALVFGPPAPVELLLVGGEIVVSSNELRTADDDELAADLRTASARLIETEVAP